MENLLKIYRAKAVLVTLGLMLGILVSESALAQSITVTGSLSSFSTSRRVASASQSYTVSGTGLGTNALVITAPSQYAVSTNNTAFSSTVSLTPSGGSVSSTTIYVRMTGESIGTFSGNITHASTGATTQNLAATGTVAKFPTLVYYQGANTGVDGTSSSGNQYPIGFNFTYKNPPSTSTYSSFYLSANGYIKFDQSNGNVSNNGPIPQSSQPNDMLAPFWDALRLDTANCSSILWRTINRANDTVCVIQWNNTKFDDGTSPPHGTFQAILYKTTNAIQFQYVKLVRPNLSFGSSGSVGIEYGGGGTVAGKQVSYNETGKLYEGFAVRFTPTNASITDYTVDTTVAFDPIWMSSTPVAPPGSPENLTPLPSASSESRMPKFKWTAQSSGLGTTSYTIVVSTNADLSSPVQTITTTDTAYRINATTLSPNTTYYYGIKANAGGSCEASWSTVQSFTTRAAAPVAVSVSPSSPVNMGSATVGTTTSPTTLTLTTTGTLSGTMTATVTGDFTINGATSVTGLTNGSTLALRFSPTASGARVGSITITGGGLDYDEEITLSGTGIAATPVISTTASLNSFTTAQSTPSTTQNYTVSATYLTSDLVVTAPTGFEVKKSTDASYSNTVTLTPSGGTVASTTINVRLTGTSAGSFSGNITHTSTGATTQNVAVSGNTALITVTGTLSAFATPQGTASAEQSYTVSASGLTGNITVTPPSGFEISTTSGGTFGNSLTLTPTSGTLASTTIYVRMTGGTAGTFSGNITHTSTGASAQNIAVSGNVRLITTTTSLNAFSTNLGSASNSQSYTVSASGLSGDLTVTAPTGYEIRTGSNAYSGTVTLSPTAGSISSTTIDVRLTGASAGNFSGNITHASTGATTQNVAVSGTVGAITVVASLSSFSTNQGTASSSQSYTVSASGLTANLAITAPTGYEIRTGSNAYSGTVTLTPTGGSIGSTTIDVRLTGSSVGSFSGNITHASTGATTQNVAVSGSVSGNPTISTTASLSAFSATEGAPSAAQNYTVSATYLTGNLTITAPSGYEIRTGSNAYGSTVTLTPASGTISSTTIDVRLTGASAGTFNGNITHAASGATTQNVAVTGTVTAVPAISVTSSLAAFSTSLGSASTSQNFTVSGSNLTADITITAPTGFEIRTGSNAYSGSVTLTPTGGTISSTTIDVRLTGASAGTFSGNVSLASTGATTQNVAVTGTVGSITVTASLNAFSTALGSSSASQSYTVSASGLSADLTITAPTGFEIRTGSNAYSGTVTLTPSAGVVSSTTIDVRLTGASGGSFSGNITHASAGAATQNVAVSGTVASITVSATLSSFSTTTGTASSSQSYTVSATGLTANLTITAPSGYEIRTGSNAYDGTVTLTQSGGSIPSTTIDVRLIGTSTGTFAGNITHASTGATTQNVAVSGTVSSGVTLPTVTTTAYITGIRLTAGTAAGNVTADGGASVTARGVCWNTTGTPTISDTRTTDGTGIGSFTSSITGLTNATVYYVRAYATNSAGTAYGATVKFTAGRVYVRTAVTGTVEGSTWADAYTDLATAISRIDSGEVWVATGTYKPTATTDRTISFTAKNNVALLGGFAGNESAASSRNATSNVTTLSGEIGSAGTSDNSYHVISGTGLDATAIIDGFTITAGNCNGSVASNYDKGAGLYLTGSPFLKRLNITGNSGTQAVGLYNLGAPTISYVTYGSGNTWVVKKQ